MYRPSYQNCHHGFVGGCFPNIVPGSVPNVAWVETERATLGAVFLGGAKVGRHSLS